MTGGWGAEESAEVILEDGSTCTLPNLPPPGRYTHSATGLTLCGGFSDDENTPSTCSTFTGQWNTSHQLGVPRYDHMSWDSPSGTILLGGGIGGTGQTTETLSHNSSTTTPSFQLLYWTRYSDLNQYNTCQLKQYFSQACSIDLGNTVVVTGGVHDVYNDTHWLARSRVQVYSTAGAGERLPDLNTPRMFHACGHYIKDDKVVTIQRFLTCFR